METHHAPPASNEQNKAEVNSYFWKFALLLTVLFLVFRIEFHGPDYPIYQSYVLSVFQDGDLNVVNNIRQNSEGISCGEFFRGLEVTRTYNYPDFHNSGSIFLWAPFFVYSQGIAELASRIGFTTPETAGRIAVSGLAFSAVALAFLSLVLIFLIAAGYFQPAHAFWGTILIFWGTPAFYYTLVENGNANIPALFMGVVFLLATPLWLIQKNLRGPLMLGLLLALCMSVKVDLWFQAVMLGASALYLWSIGRLRPLNLLHVLLGLCLGNIPKLLNEYLRYGRFRSGEAGLINLRSSYHWEQLFSPYQGYFTASPLLLICIFALLLLTWRLWNKSRRQSILHAPDCAWQRLVLAMTIWLAAKLIIIGFRYAWGGGTFGARQLLSELPYFILLLTFIISLNRTQKNHWRQFLLSTAMLLAIFVNLIHAGEFAIKEPIVYYLHPPPLMERVAHLKNLAAVCWTGLEQLPLKLSLIPLFLLTLWLGRSLLSRLQEIKQLLRPWEGQTSRANGDNRRNTVHLWLKGLTLYALLSWFVISGLNMVNNQDNVAMMTEEGCFEFANVVPRGWVELEENVASMREMVQYFTLKGDKQEVERIMTTCRLLYPTETYQLHEAEESTLLAMQARAEALGAPVKADGINP